VYGGQFFGWPTNPPWVYEEKEERAQTVSLSPHLFQTPRSDIFSKSPRFADRPTNVSPIFICPLSLIVMRRQKADVGLGGRRR